MISENIGNLLIFREKLKAFLTSESNMVELLYQNQHTYIFMKFTLLQIVTKVYTGTGMNLKYLILLTSKAFFLYIKTAIETF